MFYDDSRLQEEAEEYDNDYEYNRCYTYSIPHPEQESAVSPLAIQSSSSSSCSQGHRSSLNLQTLEGGSICLTCFSNLITNPTSPTVHVSYALSQLSRALSHPPFLKHLLCFHSHLLVSPLVDALSCFDDDPIARQVVDLVVYLCNSGDDEVLAEFVARVSGRLASGSLSWSRRQLYMLHCLGVLSNYQTDHHYAHIKDKEVLVSNLAAGLQLPSDEIRGEILFLLYKLSIFQFSSKDGESTDNFDAYCPMLLRLSLEALMKTQNDDVRLNCIAFLTVVAQRGFFAVAYENGVSSMNCCEDDNFMETREDTIDGIPLHILFAEAIKGPLLSSDGQVQTSALNLIFHYLSWEGAPEKQIQALLEENIADYVFEILRLSEGNDSVINSCLLVLNLLSMADLAFRQRLAVGFATLIPILHYVAEVPFHPVQSQTLKLVLNCVSNFPGILSNSHIEELGLVLEKMLKRHIDGEMGMLPETFIFACSIFVALIKSPSSHGIMNFITSLQEASKHAVLACLSVSKEHPRQLLHSLYLLKEAYACSHEGSFTDSSILELRYCIVDVCKTHLLPWLGTGVNDMEVEMVLGILEAFQSILLWDSDTEAIAFAEILISSSWFSFSFKCLGLFPTEKMKGIVYLMFSSIVDVLQGNDSGEIIRDAAAYLPSDPMDLLYLLGQKSSHNLDLAACQTAIIVILYFSSLYDERLADDKLVLASLEQYILVNCSDFLYGGSNSLIIVQLVNLYGLYRGLAKISYQISYSPEAEKFLFQLLVDKDWDLASAGIHPRALKWFFQQDKLIKPLSSQILKFCRISSLNGAHMIVHRKSSQNLDVQDIAELVAAADNQGPMLMVFLLKELMEEGGSEHDIISVVNLIVTILNLFPCASNQLCLLGIGNAIQYFYCHRSQSSSPEIFIAISLLAFNILCSVSPETLSDDGAWFTVTMKLMDHLVSTMAADKWTQESLLVVGILSLILHHSTNGALAEASRTIHLNSSLASAIHKMISSTSSKGPPLIDHDEEKSKGEILIYMLLLCYFSVKSLPAVLPGFVDWRNFFDSSSRIEQFSVISIHCHDLCRLMHFGSPPVKLVASYCLLELITRISEQLNRKHDDLNCIVGYLMSVMGVLKGFVFYNDIRVAMNCALCLSMILGLEKLDMKETREIGKNNWFRFIVEELVVSLPVPHLASTSFMNHHRPAVHVAVALLKGHKVPLWMRSVLDDARIFGLIEKLSANNVSTEMVLLFRELLISAYLKDTQIAHLNQILQACRRSMYAGNTRGDGTEELLDKVFSVQDDLGKVGEFLIHLIASNSSSVVGSRGSKIEMKRLLEEIELFLKEITVEEDG